MKWSCVPAWPASSLGVGGVRPREGATIEDERNDVPVAVQADHPLQTLELILLQSTSNENIRLLAHLLLDPMRHRIIIDLRLLLLVFDNLCAKHTFVHRPVLRHIHIVHVLILLRYNRLRQRIQVRVSLLE